MQTSSIDKLRTIATNTLKVLKFVWRHLLTLIVFGMMVAALIIGKISWENCFYFYVGAIYIDWLKTGVRNPRAHDKLMSNSRADRDFSRIGTSAWRANPGMIGSGANYLNNVGTSSRYY